MLSDDPKKLRFLGIDLHSRTRRRILVTLIYALYALALAGVQVFFEDHPIESTAWGVPGGSVEVIAMCLISIVFTYGIFRENGPIKPFGPKRLFNRYGDRLILETRDDWAKYTYEESFANLPPDGQAEVRRRYRPGKYLARDKPFYVAGFPDERELAEIGAASRRALNIMGFLLICSAISLARRTVRHQPEDPLAAGLELAVAAMTLPKAIILWSEPDPRQYHETEQASADAQIKNAEQ